MSQKAQKQDTVDRTRMSWILNIILNQKTQQEIVKDIADGILDFKEIEDIFPWKFVQGLRQCTPENAQNYLNRFKNMTDERMKGLLTQLMSRKSRDEVFRLITDHSSNLDDIQKSYLRSYMEVDDESASSMTSNISINLNKMLSKGATIINMQNSKEPKDVGTKKKKNAAKKGEKDAETKKKGNNVEKAAKKVRVVKLKNEKRIGDINDRNKVEGTSEEISSTKENPLPPVDDEEAPGDLTKSLLQTLNEGFEESSLKSSQGDRATYKLPVRCDTKKTANSKNLASDNTKLASARKASKKTGKDVKPGARNKENYEVNNFSSLSKSDDYTEENEKSKGNESDVENENMKNSYVIRNGCLHREVRTNDGFKDSLQKSRANQPTNITSMIDMREQDIHGNKENELNHIREYNFNIQLDTSTPKKWNCETNRILIKEESKSECSFSEFDHSIDYYKEQDFNINKVAFKEVSSHKNKERLNTKMSNASVSTFKKTTEPSRVAKAEKTRGRAKKEIIGKKAKEMEHKKGTEDRWTKTRRFDRKEQKKKEKMRRHEKKMQKAMAQFSDQVVKLVKNMGYLEEDDESSSSCSSESSYSSSSESCSCSSCSCCDCFSSSDYSEYTLCSCSNCGSSYSSTDSD